MKGYVLMKGYVYMKGYYYVITLSIDALCLVWNIFSLEGRC